MSLSQTKSLLVTGGTGGIGSAVVEQMARDGWSVCFLWHENQEKAERLTRTLRQEGCQVTNLRLNLADLKEVERFASLLRSGTMQFDAFVHAAGTSLTKLFQETDNLEWDQLYLLHLRSADRLIQGVLPHMLSQQEGRIVTLSSIWGETGGSMEVAYSAIKSGVIGYTKALAKELGPSGITVNCVSPGLIDTKMNGHLPKEAIADFCEQTPLGRMGTAQEVAAGVKFLLSPEASFITGHVLDINGGAYI